MISISERSVKDKDIAKFFKKLYKLTEHYGFTKGIYSGEANVSQLFIYEVEKDFEYIFGNSNPSNMNISEDRLFKLEDIRGIFKDIQKNVRKYSKEQLFTQMRNVCLELANKLEMEFRRATNNSIDT